MQNPPKFKHHVLLKIGPEEPRWGVSSLFSLSSCSDLAGR